MHPILQHCYFKSPLFHNKTLLNHDSYIGFSESLSDGTSSFKNEFKMSFDLKFPMTVRPPNAQLLLLEFLSRPEPVIGGDRLYFLDFTSPIFNENQTYWLSSMGLYPTVARNNVLGRIFCPATANR